MFLRSTFRYTSAIALMAFASHIYAYNVSGIIVSPDGEGCPNAVYHIYAETDTIRPILNAITNVNGDFSQQLNHSGNFLFQGEYMGIYTSLIPFTLSDDSPEHNFGRIVINPIDNQLEEVVVTGRRTIIVSDGANLQYNVQQDPTATTSTILEMLRKVPMVTVDGEDNIRVNGSSDFKILLNGKPNPMFDSEPQRVLRSLPASTISRIEVLTDPGAKYDAEGTGGILNIVTEVGTSQQVSDGYAGNISLEAGLDNQSATGYIRGKYRNVSGSASITYARAGLIKREAKSFSEDTYLEDEENYRLVSNMNQPDGNNFNFWQGNAFISWEPNTKNLFSASVNLMDISGNQNMQGVNEMFDKSGQSKWQLPRELYAKLSRLNVTADASYQHLFDGQDNSLTTSVQLSHGNQNMDINNIDGELSTLNFMNTQTNEFTFQTDWLKKLNDIHTFEAGAKGVLTDNRNDSHTQIDALTTDGVDMKQHRNLGAVYGSYSGTFGKWLTKLGLRYEYTNLGVNFMTDGYDGFESYLNDIVPNASIAWAFSPVSTLRMAYNMRISRPDISQLNPYQFSLKTNEIMMGNPNLTSQHSNNLSLAFSSFSGKVQYNIKAEYQNVNNLISDFVYSENQILYHTYRNSGTQQNGILSAYANWFISPMIMLSVNGTLQYTDFRVKNLNLNRHGWSGNAGGNFNWTLPCRLSISAFGGWSSKTVTLQGNRSGWHYYGIGFSRPFFKDDALKLSLNATNMLTKWTHWTNRTFTDSTISYSRYSRQSWNISIGIQWNFGHLKQNIRSVENRIDNNDKVSTGSNNGGGIL